MKLIKFFYFAWVLSLAFPANAETYLTKKDFLKLAFSDATQAAAKTLWLDKTLQAEIKQILDHRYPKLRLKYWQNQQQTVWFLEEIGKEKPITFGVSIIDKKVHTIKVLAFRESRGWEIRYQSFTEQFDDISVDSEGHLDKHIDGITGATMSVSAMKKITRLALMLDKKVTE